MSLNVTTIMLGVEDMARSKKVLRGRAGGGNVVKEAAAARWGGYFGYFSDPDGYLWKVASAS